MNNLGEGIQLILNYEVLILLVLGVLIGLIVGAIPGMTDPMALGLAIPFTFAMEPINAILFLLAIHFGALYGGVVTAILINTPGTPAAAALTLDGYPLTQQGDSRKALQMASISALGGGIISALSLILLAPFIAQFALRFGPQEYFALGMFGLSVVAGVAGKSLVKATSAAALGIFVSTIGADPLFGIQRFTFGSYFLYDGIDLVTALIGLYALSEIFRQLVLLKSTNENTVDKINLSNKGVSLQEVKENVRPTIKGGLIGVIIGALPGTGAPISAFISYGEALRSSKKPEKFGKGNLEGVSSANSSSIGTESSAMIPLLTLGIPGDVSMAILLSTFLLHGISIGPDLFEQSGDLVYAIYVGIIILILLVFVFSWFGSNILAQIVKIPKYYLYPIIIVLVVAGTFTLMNSLFNVWIAVVFGIVGFYLILKEYPIAPLLLGIILGPIIEQNFLASMSESNGDILTFVTRPISATILIVAVLAVIIMSLSQRKIQKKFSDVSEK